MKILLFYLVLMVATAPISSLRADVIGIQQISGPMVEGGDIRPFPQISPTGDYIVYTADQEINNSTEIYSVAVANLQLTKLNPDFTVAQNVTKFLISPDGLRVVYLADQDNNFKELYSVPIGGGNPVKLNLAVDFEGVQDFKITPDSATVVYSAGPSEPSTEDGRIFSVPITGGGSQALNDQPLDDVTFFSISPDSARVVYTARSFFRSNIYSAQLNDGTAMQLNPALADGDNIFFFSISNDSQNVVYRLQRGINTTAEADIQSVPIGGGTSIKLNGVITSRKSFNHPLITQDSNTVVFSQKHPRSAEGGSFTQRTQNIYAVPVGGGDLTMIDTDESLNIAVRPDSILISNNAENLVYVEETIATDGSRKYEIYSAPLSGAARVKLSDNFDAAFYQDLVMTEDNSTVFFLATSTDSYVRGLFSVPINGGDITKVSDTLAFEGGVSEYVLTTDQQWVLYRADQLKNNVYELFIAPVTGEFSGKVSGKLVKGGDVEFDGFAMSPDGNFVIYSADQDVLFETELYLATTDVPPLPPRESGNAMCLPIIGENGILTVVCL